MAMDALTAAAFEALLKEVLPKLSKELAGLAKLAAEKRVAGESLQFLLPEAFELLTLVSQWAKPAGETLDELPDDDALRMLEADAASATAPKGVASRSVADALDASDDMDEAPSPWASAPEGEDGGEMSDEDAAMLLAMGGSPSPEASAHESGEMSDEEARMLLDAMDGPAAPEPAEGGEMSDEEARKLLDAMDGPPSPKASAPKAGDGGEMSDEEARKLLEEMDGPSSPKASAPKAADGGGSVMNADDEALAMLAAFEGASSAEATAPKASGKTAAKVAATWAPMLADERGDGGEEEEEVLHEIEELAANDFARDPDMMIDFSSNTDELMETLDKTILELENDPTNRETIDVIFRAAHTLKGAAGMFGFKAIERVMHRMENLFDLVRKGTLVPDSNTIDVVFQGFDVLRTLLDGAKEGKVTGAKTVPIVRALELAAKGKYRKGMGSTSTSTTTSTGTSAGTSASAGGGEDGGDGEERSGAGREPKKKKEEQSTIRVDLERLDHLVNLVGELVIDRTRFATIEEDIRATSPQLKVAGNMSETVQLFGRHMNEIYEIIMKIRMVPIGNAFNKFTRIVRDLSRQLGKDIELMIDGEETELDKTLVEQIGDPLIHLIRNSCDHGVEMPDARVASGKNAAGKIFLSARQEGNHIIITIEDDGKGIDTDRVRRKAVERGLISEDTVLSDRDIVNLIFEPGFSTAEQVTTVSGRGVGMDVVRKQISKLKGLIDINSKLGQGTTTTIRLPLTLAIVQSLLIESQGEVFAIPLSTVVESVRIKPEEIQTVGDAEVIKRHGKVLPLMHLHDTLELARKAETSWYSGYHRNKEEQTVGSLRVNRRKDRLYVVIVGSGDRRFGIVVDQLLHQQEMVIKSLGPIMKKTPCVAGGAVLGNGEVVLVLDIQELEDRFRSRTRHQAAA